MWRLTRRLWAASSPVSLCTERSKTTVLGLKQRKGRLVTQVIPDVSTATLKPIVLDTVEEGATVSTDQLRSYNLLKNYGYQHDTVDHSRDEWARGDVHVNSLE